MQLFDRTLGQWLEHWAEETPDKEYIVYSDIPTAIFDLPGAN